MTNVIGLAGRHYTTELYSVRNAQEFETAVRALIEEIGAERALAKVEDFVASQSRYIPTAATVETIFRQAERRADRNVIQVSAGREMSDVVDEAIEALAGLDVYQRGNSLVDFVRAAEPDANRGEFDLTGLPKIRHIPSARLREYLNEAARFEFGNGTRMPAPPRWVVETLAARGQWRGIPPLYGVAPFPLLRADGTVLDRPGYDPPTGLYYVKTVDVTVPKSPTRADAEKALAEILDVVRDFPFKDAASKAGYVAALLTPLARHAIDGPVPIFCFNANTPAAGKGLLVDTIGHIVQGRDVPKGELTENEEELSKRLATIALKGAAMACFDNVKSIIGGAMLEGLATANTVEGRKLGKLEDFELPWRTSLFVTGNNLYGTPDMVRRIIMPTLESPLERPEERAGLRNLIEFCQENRASLLTAALTILRAYQAAGRPAIKMRAMGSFERWSAVVRAPIVWLGMADPVDTQMELRDAGDPEREAHELLIEKWFATFGESQRTVKQVLASTAMADAVAGFVELKAYDDCTARGVKLGAKLRTVKNKPVGGRKLVSHKKTKAGVTWSVVRVVPT